MRKFFRLSSLIIIFSVFFTTTVSAQLTYKTTPSRLDSSFFTAWFGIVCCSIIFSFTINAVCAYIIYNDAIKNNIDNAILWAIFGFFFSWIAILIYFLAIKPGAVGSKTTRISDKPVLTEIDTVSEPVELIKDTKSKKTVKKAKK